MISTQDRRQAITLIDEAVAAGARRAHACALLGLSVRTVQRWTRDGVREDRRPHVAILAQRQALYTQAKAAHPERWSGTSRDWTPPGAVTLNPAGAAAQPLGRAA
jgi:hypothetical protein